MESSKIAETEANSFRVRQLPSQNWGFLRSNFLPQNLLRRSPLPQEEKRNPRKVQDGAVGIEIERDRSYQRERKGIQDTILAQPLVKKDDDRNDEILANLFHPKDISDFDMYFIASQWTTLRVLGSKKVQSFKKLGSLTILNLIPGDALRSSQNSCIYGNQRAD
ncbi:hypothetical protein HHK36_011677 [Tetracentron sinense]|uniref:Uncharacterized protein n=1 Tax=Tetracentron sinense TaxID=13715 RepID=A0A835DHF5_TETSI|nr:hypothetical protein HHK36_011677 [Tetracentron sinense]